MSRWLKQVNSLLEKLDGTVEGAIEEQVGQRHESRHGEGNDAIQSILARRGLTSVEDEVNGEPLKIPVDAPVHEHKTQSQGDFRDGIVELEPGSETATPEHPTFPAPHLSTPLPNDLPKQNDEGDPKAVGFVANDELNTVEKTECPDPDAKGSDQEERTLESNENSGEISLSLASNSNMKRTNPQSAPVQADNTYENEYKTALADARDAHKEARMLRRHVVALNSQLEAVEAETKAQRAELERVGERMEKDRARAKEEKERVIARHADEIKALRKQQETIVDELKSRNEHLIEESRNQLREVEKRRKEEGGDWNKELLGAIEREQEAQRKCIALEDEKSILLSQINMLQGNSEGLGNRLEAMSQAADNAMLREREAEDKLDAALSLHARQLSQRQAREGQLERTIADLGAALVVARSKTGENINEAVDGAEDSWPHKLRAQFDQYENDIDNIRNQLDHERQRAKTLHDELRDMSKERADEALLFRSKQTQYDRQLADMSVTIARLQSCVRDAKRDSMLETSDVDQVVDSSSHVKCLSDEVMKQQEKLVQCGSELAALKNRLKVAVQRADQAELALAIAEAEGSRNPFDVEDGPSSGGMRRRGGKRGQLDNENGGSIRSAFLLNNPQNQQAETVGKAIDALDSFAVQTGKFLRSNPLARGGFLLYLIVLHIWTFLVLFFHAHSYEPVHGDFGSQQFHGPNTLMQQHVLLPQQLEKNIARVATVKAPTAIGAPTGKDSTTPKRERKADVIGK